MGHGGHVPPLLQMTGRQGHHEQEKSKEETEQTALTITNALTETTNCTFRAKKVEGHDQKKFLPKKRRIGAPTIAADRCTSHFVLAPLETYQ